MENTNEFSGGGDSHFSSEILKAIRTGKAKTVHTRMPSREFINPFTPHNFKSKPDQQQETDDQPPNNNRHKFPSPTLPSIDLLATKRKCTLDDIIPESRTAESLRATINLLKSNNAQNAQQELSNPPSPLLLL